MCGSLTETLKSEPSGQSVGRYHPLTLSFKDRAFAFWWMPAGAVMVAGLAIEGTPTAKTGDFEP